MKKLGVQVREMDVEACPRHPNVLQLKSRSHQIQDKERGFAQAVCSKEHDDVLLLGNTPAVEGFFLRMKHPIQLKEVGEGKPDPPPGGFVQAFLKSLAELKGLDWPLVVPGCPEDYDGVRKAEMEHTRNSAEVGIAALEQADHACLRALL